MTERSGDGWRYAIALIEIQGGLVGLWGFVRDLAASGLALPGALLPGIAVIGLVLAASTVAGVGLWFDRRWAVALSLPVQLAQLIWFVSTGLTFRVGASGWLLADLFLRWRDEGGTVLGWQFDAARKAGYALSLAPRGETTVALNLVALAILFWLVAQLRRHRAD